MSIFDEAYCGIPNWDIGRAQPVFVSLHEAGEISGDVLDVGCGTGENALFLAERGREGLGSGYDAACNRDRPEEGARA